MMKWLSFLIAVIATVATQNAFSDTWLIDGRGRSWSCVKNQDGTVKITGIDPQTAGRITIPSSLDGMPVTRIDDKAFCDNTLLTSLTIPGSVKYIGSGIIKLGDSTSQFRVVFTSDIGTMEFQRNIIDGEAKRLTVEVIPKNGSPFVGWLDKDGNEIKDVLCSPTPVVVTPKWSGDVERDRPRRKRSVERCQPVGNDSNSTTYDRSKFSVAVVNGDEGKGTGFLCEMDGKKYFVTNKHVASQRGKIEAMFMDGTRLTFDLDSPIDVAINRDLVRFAVNTELPCLSLYSGTPQIGERIEFYGNAVGGGVITMTAGSILAVGMERIEISSPIQAGNSGSPLVLENDGNVIGVTTLSEFNRLDNDPSKVGTRYDPNVKLTREYAVRFLGLDWKSMTYRAFLKEINVYMDYCKFFAWMQEICLASNQALIFEYKLPDLQFSELKRLNALMKKIAKCDEMLKRNVDRLAKMEERSLNNTGRAGGYGAMEIRNAKRYVRDSNWTSYKVRKDVLASAISYAKSDTVLSKEDKESVIDAFDWMYRKYCEKFRRQLQGNDLESF